MLIKKDNNSILDIISIYKGVIIIIFQYNLSKKKLCNI